MLLICLLSLLLADFANSLKFVKHPEYDFDITQRIRYHGYPLEIHEVTTEDNYILTVHRIPHGRNLHKSNNSSPVLIVHGMGVGAEHFLALGTQRSLPYYLADRGFDVWILNARGSVYSLKHKYYNADRDNKYWRFSLHEIGVYDLPANIDYIVNITNQKVFLIGHSQGNTCYFIMASERPEYEEKIKISAVYAPSVILKYMDYPLATFFCYLVNLLEMIYNAFAFVEFVPLLGGLSEIPKLICSEKTYFKQICLDILSIIGTHESKLLEDETVSAIFTITLSRISSKQIFHYMQIIKSGVFRQYDYGVRGNIRMYNRKTPPLYNLTRSHVPVAIFYAEKDDLASLKGGKVVVETIPNVILDYKVPYKYFNHIDFLFASNATTLVYQPTSQLFNEFDKGLYKEITSKEKTPDI